MQPISITVNEPGPWVSIAGTISGVIVGALLPFVLTRFTKRQEEARRRHSALLQLRGALRSVFPVLQTAFDQKIIDREILISTLDRFITIARDPNVLAHLNDEKQALWIAGATTMFEVVAIHFKNGVYEPVIGDPLRRHVVPDATATTVLLPALSAAASTLQALDDLAYFEKNALLSVKRAISDLTNRNREARRCAGESGKAS